MQESSLLAVGFVDFILVRRGRNAQEIIECYSWPLGKFDFIAQTEDFLICGLQLAIGFYLPCRAPKCDVSGTNLPSLLHAATTAIRQARMATVKNGSLIFGDRDK